jgi:large subunit ribosomal protein L25
MENLSLEVQPNNYPNVKSVRQDDRLPIICYSKGEDPKQFTADYQDFRRTYNKAGKSSIINFVSEGKEVPIIVHEIQYDPLTDRMIHIDVMAVDLKNAIHTEVPLVFTGTAPAVQDLGGILVTNKDTLSIECLPKDLPHEIEVDITPLVDFHSSLSVADIKLPEAITVHDAPELTIATVSAPRSEEPEEAAAEEVAEEGGSEESGAEGETKAE